MSFDSTISPLLTSTNVADTPSYELDASSNVIGSSTYNTDVVWGGPGGTFQIITTGNLASLAQVETRGLLAIKTVGSGLVTALITEGNGISVEESGDDFLVSVIPNTTTQLVTGQCNGTTASSPKNKINFVAGANVSLSLEETSDALNWTINASGSGGGGDASEWSTFPATEDVDMDEFGLINVQGITLSEDVLSNTVFGYQAGSNITSGHHNVIIGDLAGAALTTTRENVIIGASASETGVNTTQCIYIGDHAGGDGTRNIGIGSYALSNSTNGNNIALGYETGLSLTSGLANTLIGNGSGIQLTDGSSNICIGRDTGASLTTGSNNIVLGTSNVNFGVDSFSCVLIGDSAGGNGTDVTQSTAVGYQARFQGFSQSTALGYRAMCTADNQVMLSNEDSTVVFPGQLSIPTNAVNGYVLTSDSDGLATWQNSTPTLPTVSISTIDATPTNIEIIEVPLENCITVTGSVSAIDDGKTDACGGNFSITAFSGSGGVTLVSPSYITMSTSSTATFDVNVDAGSGFIILTVTGLAATTYNWVVTYSSIQTTTA